MKILLQAMLLAMLAPLAGCAGLAGPKPTEPRVQHLVAEDDKVRIEELRVRGQTQRITVNPKGEGARPYEIHTAPAGSDPSKGREGVGQSLWPVLTF
jgi:hypothetical protein